LKALAVGAEFLLYTMEPRGKFTLNSELYRYEKFISVHFSERQRRQSEEKFYNAFYYLRKKGMDKSQVSRKTDVYFPDR